MFSDGTLTQLYAQASKYKNKNYFLMLKELEGEKFLGKSSQGANFIRTLLVMPTAVPLVYLLAPSSSLQILEFHSAALLFFISTDNDTSASSLNFVFKISFFPSSVLIPQHALIVFGAS